MESIASDAALPTPPFSIKNRDLVETHGKYRGMVPLLDFSKLNQKRSKSKKKEHKKLIEEHVEEKPTQQQEKKQPKKPCKDICFWPL